MTDQYYEQLLDDALRKLLTVVDQKLNLEVEIAKLQQFIYATSNLLSDDGQKRFEAKWRPFADKLSNIATSLTDSVRNVLSTCYPKQLTAAQVRDQLRVTGFDFSTYTSDPLPSVSTTLRRLKDAQEIDSDEYEGVAVYRAKPPKPAPRKFTHAFRRPRSLTPLEGGGLTPPPKREE